jgi:hypothetical protein
MLGVEIIGPLFSCALSCLPMRGLKKAKQT